MAVSGGARFCPACRVELPDFPLSPGTRLDGDRYEVLGLVRAGGMGAVYRGSDARLNKEVALKQLLPGSDDPYLKQRFAAEGNWLSRLSHPALPRVTDSFEARDCLFLVMDLIPGRDLERELEARGGAFPLEEALDLGVQLLDVLEFLHGLEPPVVYRDLKPANVMLREDGRICLVDFGLATSPAPTTGTAIGTEGYCPLEQYQGRAEPRSDLYALGATLYHLLTGTPPVPLRYEPPGSAIPVGVEQVLRRAMALQPEDRFADARAFRAALMATRSETRQGRDGASMVRVEGGSYRLGSRDDPDCGPPRTAEVQGFWIDRFPVTNSLFRRFVEETGHTVAGAWPEWARPGSEEHPAVGVTWHDAVAYCRWAGKRLPTEDEWEVACSGGDGRRFPWGTEWDPRACIHGTAREVPMLDLVKGRGTAGVGSFPHGASPCGCLDLAGNVWEWTATRTGQDGRVLKGGCWSNRDPGALACASRLEAPPQAYDCRRGFRGVEPVSSSDA